MRSSADAHESVSSARGGGAAPGLLFEAAPELRELAQRYLFELASRFPRQAPGWYQFLADHSRRIDAPRPGCLALVRDADGYAGAVLVREVRGPAVIDHRGETRLSLCCDFGALD